MKVLQIINSLGTGGAEKLISELVPNLIKKGNDVDILLLNGAETPLKKQLREKGVNIYCIGLKNNIYNPLIIFKLKKYISKYDIVHVHLFPALYWTAFAKLIFYLKVKLVYTEHSTTNRRRNLFIFKPFDRIAYKLYDSIICISKETKGNLFKYIGKDKKIKIINNGVNLIQINQAIPLDKRTLIPQNGYEYLIIMVAAFRKAKDQDTLIRAISILPDAYHLLLVGDGVRIGICKQLVSELNINERVHFLGNRNDVPQLLKASDIVVLSSHWEGFGLAAVEGMAAHKPVIASNVQGLSEIVNGSGLLFDVGDFKMLSSNIISLITNKKLYNSISSKCFEKSKEFDIQEMIDKYNNIYISLINKNNA